MNVHFNLELSSNGNLQSEKSILIRLTQLRKHKRISTGIQVNERYWDPIKKRVKNTHPLSAEYNGIVTTKLKEIMALYSRLFQLDPQISIEELLRSQNKHVSSNFFDFAYSTKMEEIKATNKKGTYKRYETVLSKLAAYGGKGLSLKRINYSFLKEYSIYLKSELKNTDDTVSSNLSVIRSIINEAIRHGVYTNPNPFEQLNLKYTNNTKEKLTGEEMKRLMSSTLPDVPSFHLARDFFMACFLAEGTRAGDMMLMKKINIMDGRLIFNQQKTGTPMAITIVDPLLEIFKSYNNNGPHLFPFLNNCKKIDEQIINSKITYVNKYLKEVAKYCGIFKKLTTHVSRHTFTDLALQATNENIYLVQKSLGHSSVRTTEIYSKKRVNFNRTSPIPAIVDLINNKNTVTE